MVHNTRVFIPIKPLSRHDKMSPEMWERYKAKVAKYLRYYRRNGRIWLKVKILMRGPTEIDIDNFLVPLMNILEGRWFHNDKQIKHLEATIVEYHHEYGFYIEIGRLP